MKGRQYDLIVAFYPHARGFSYIVFEGPLSPVDWGMSDLPAKEKARRCLRRLSLLLDQYQPDALLIREVSKARRMRSIAGLLKAIKQEASVRGVYTAGVSRKQIRETFAYLGSPTRRAIVEAIAKRIPTLASYVPPIRKIWNGEDRRMGLFDAAALALTFLGDRNSHVWLRGSGNYGPVHSDRP
jgi:hypothetical protein